MVVSLPGISGARSVIWVVRLFKFETFGIGNLCCASELISPRNRTNTEKKRIEQARIEMAPSEKHMIHLAKDSITISDVVKCPVRMKFVDNDKILFQSEALLPSFRGCYNEY